MSYQISREHPACVTNRLPQHAQALYLKAFKIAWDQYASMSSRRANETREEAAHKIAWSAVENIYEQDEKSGTWKLKRSMELQRL
ncbi:MAG: ChaB family protein [Chloroflexota bacterium]